MKPCKLTFQGKRYVIESDGLVCEYLGMSPIPGCYDARICEQEESETVLKEVKRIRAKRARQARHQAYLDCGLVRVKGALGGTYYE